MTKPYAEVIGDPIAQSKSPVIHNFWFDKLGIDAQYRKCHVKADGLAAYFAERRADPDWRGCNVTIPHKQAVMQFLDSLDDGAEAVGAVNTIWRDGAGNLCGTNTDVDGVAEAIAPVGGDAGRAVVIGAGGAARAAFATLAGRQFGKVVVVARSESKARDAIMDCSLDADILPFDQIEAALEGASLLINATQLGMIGQQAMPDGVLGAVRAMDDSALVFDMVYSPLETQLLSAVRGNGLAISDGLVMLVGQAATAFEKFFGLPAPREHDAELRKLLTS